MKNYGLPKLKDKDINNFTSITGLKIRRIINKPVRLMLRGATKGKIRVESYPELEKDKPYIFAATHSFVEEIPALLATIDRSAYTLMGSTNQLEYNPRVYANWVTGIVFVDRYSKKSREESISKMEKVIKNGSSIIMFPEGGWNNTENLLVQKLFAGPYLLSKQTNTEVVPVSTFNEPGSKDIYICMGEPLKLYEYDKEEALRILRDSLATMQYNQILRYSTPIVRSELPKDPRLDFMEQRRQEYLKTKWTKDVWDEELTQYLDADDREYNAVLDSYENITITPKNADLVASMLVKNIEKNKYDFKEYMHNNWNK